MRKCRVMVHQEDHGSPARGPLMAVQGLPLLHKLHCIIREMTHKKNHKKPISGRKGLCGDRLPIRFIEKADPDFNSGQGRPTNL